MTSYHKPSLYTGKYLIIFDSFSLLNKSSYKCVLGSTGECSSRLAMSRRQKTCIKFVFIQSERATKKGCLQNCTCWHGEGIWTRQTHIKLAECSAQHSIFTRGMQLHRSDMYCIFCIFKMQRYSIHNIILNTNYISHKILFCISNTYFQFMYHKYMPTHLETCTQRHTHTHTFFSYPLLYLNFGVSLW